MPSTSGQTSTRSPNLNKPLISIGTLCDNNCTAVFNATTLTIVDQQTQQTIIKGKRYPSTILYMVDMENTQQLMTTSSTTDNLVTNHAYETKPKQDLVLFYHATCFSPTKNAFIKAIKNGAFTSWPGVIAKLAQKYLPKTEATVKGHLKQKYKGTRTTQQNQQLHTTNPWNRSLNKHTKFF